MSINGNAYRRKEARVAFVIVALSALCMIVCMALFFRAEKKKTETAAVPTDKKTEDTADTAESAETTARVTEAPTDTEIPDTTDTAVVTATPEPTETEAETVTAQIPAGDVPASYDEGLLSAVALPEGTAPAGYRDALVFFGDSTTYGMKHYKVFGDYDTKQVWTPSSGTLALFRATTDLIYDPNTGTELSLKDICAAEKPEYLIVTLGVNGVSFLDEASFKAEYKNVIDTIRTASPDTKLILQSIYPVARSYEQLDSINNEKIQNANKWIVELASAYGLPYLNTYYALVDEGGWLPEAYQNGDGMHFNEVGFGVIMDYILAHPYTA